MRWIGEEILRVFGGRWGCGLGGRLVHFLWEGAVVAAVLGVVLQLLGGGRRGRYVAACLRAGGDDGCCRW